MNRRSPLASLCIAATLATGLAGTAIAADQTDLQRYRQMVTSYRAGPMAGDLGVELASMSAWINAAEGHMNRGQLEEADRLVDQIQAQVGLIEARLSLARTREARSRADIELTRIKNETERTERAIKRLQEHRARLDREEA